jgi:hypothetical protein
MPETTSCATGKSCRERPALVARGVVSDVLGGSRQPLPQERPGQTTYPVPEDPRGSGLARAAMPDVQVGSRGALPDSVGPRVIPAAYRSALPQPSRIRATRAGLGAARAARRSDRGRQLLRSWRPRRSRPRGHPVAVDRREGARGEALGEQRTGVRTSGADLGSVRHIRRPFGGSRHRDVERRGPARRDLRRARP